MSAETRATARRSVTPDDPLRSGGDHACASDRCTPSSRSPPSRSGRSAACGSPGATSFAREEASYFFVAFSAGIVVLLFDVACTVFHVSAPRISDYSSMPVAFAFALAEVRVLMDPTATVLRATREAGGTVSVDSTPGRTAFRFVLPALQA